jgi:6-phosphogluconate dehydrogenase
MGREDRPDRSLATLAAMAPPADIGVVGLAVMGQNLVLNLADHGHRVAVFNRTGSVTEEFVARAPDDVVGTGSLEELVDALATPRVVLLMVRAGGAVDAVLDQLGPLLDPGDVVIDGGNSHFEDTSRRGAALDAAGIRFVGAGISGGEEGARHGPSIMPGGDRSAWDVVGPVLQSIAAVDDDGRPCCDWLGPGGSGHYVKMVHNGIEYGDMAVIAEAYGLMRAMGMGHNEMAEVFDAWNDGPLDSFLVGITADILRTRDTDGSPLVEKILDAAGQKGTGKWTAISSLELGMPVTLVAEAVYARIVSALVDARHATAAVLGPDPVGVPAVSVDDLHDALYASKIVSYAQGFLLLAAASSEFGWELDLGRVASLWREGCIIRAAFLDDITAAYARDPSLDSLLVDEFFAAALGAAAPGWRRVVAEAALAGVPTPAYASALAFFDGFRSERTTANLIQAQRDYFGAHTYERVDRPRGETFHTDWTGSGGPTTSTSYDS